MVAAKQDLQSRVDLLLNDAEVLHDVRRRDAVAAKQIDDGGRVALCCRKQLCDRSPQRRDALHRLPGACFVRLCLIPCRSQQCFEGLLQPQACSLSPIWGITGSAFSFFEPLPSTEQFDRAL